jgi:hypothetical protein
MPLYRHRVCVARASHPAGAEPVGFPRVIGGTEGADAARVRVLLFCLACSACVAAEHPAVIPNLSALPEDGTTRDAIVDSSFSQPSAEQQPTTPEGRKLETTAATAAAILGMMFSKTDNVSLGARLDTDDSIGPKRHPDSDRSATRRQAKAQSQPRGGRAATTTLKRARAVDPSHAVG